MVDKSQWPERIRIAFAQSQHQSELIVSAVQLGILCLLFLILCGAPIGYSPDAPIHSALLGLSLFTILVLGRLWLVYSNQLTNLLLGVSVVLEMTLLLFTIESYYIQFESVPAINLKNSHVNYIYILIALRTLRFEPLWVLLSGLTAMIGWFLIVYQALHVSTMQAITWDYVTFASTRSIYLGAEFDKILSIGIVTLILALTLQRAQKTLALSVTNSFAAKDLSRFFDDAVAQKIIQSNKTLEAGQAEKRHGVIVFIDLRGFSKLSESIDSSELIGILREYQQLLVPIVQQWGGTIDKFMGDGILASFGVVIPSDTYAADALRAIDDMISAGKQWKLGRENQGKMGLDIGMGLAIGDVLLGLIGDKNRLEYTVIGETVNIAAKLEKHNKIEQASALATTAVLEEAKNQGYTLTHTVEVRLSRTVAGIDEKCDLVVLA